MQVVFPFEASFDYCFNPESGRFEKMFDTIKAHAIGTTAQSAFDDNGNLKVTACFIMQGKDKDGSLHHWVTPALSVSTQPPGKATIAW